MIGFIFIMHSDIKCVLEYVTIIGNTARAPHRAGRVNARVREPGTQLTVQHGPWLRREVQRQVRHRAISRASRQRNRQVLGPLDLRSSAYR